MHTKTVRVIKFCRIHQKVFQRGKWLSVDRTFLAELHQVCATFQFEMVIHIAYCDLCRERNIIQRDYSNKKEHLMPTERICHRCKESTTDPVLYQGKFYHDICVERELREKDREMLSLTEALLRAEERQQIEQDRKNYR